MERIKPLDNAIILDIDGVVNSFSNRKFYVSFAYHALHELAKMKSRRQLLADLPKLKKMGGANALFKFARYFCKDTETFNTYCHNLSLKLNYNLIKYDPSMKAFMKRLSSFSDIIIRSDGLREIACAAWLRVVENWPSAQIKATMIKNRTSSENILLAGKPLHFSGLVENKFKIKAESPDSWKDFADKYRIELTKSILIDDSRNNCKIAEKLGMTTVHISKLDSFLQNLPINVYHQSLSDVLGVRLSHTLRKMNISYGQKIDIKSFFSNLLKMPVKSFQARSRES